MRKACLPLAIALALATAGCARHPAPEQTPAETNVRAQHDDTAAVFLHLFEWRWVDIATECENILGPAGYQAVQVSPPNEHVVGPQWWTRYQPVSYRIESRGGTRAEFADMTARCKAVGVDVYADAVTNHMAGIFTGTGFAGSAYAEYDYPVPYGPEDFHRCGRHEDDKIRNYQDLWEVQNCKLGTLQDLDTGKPSVQQKIAAYLDDLLSLGVAGFRLDAAKHMPVDDITAFLALLDAEPFIYQEVIDRGGEPINGADYLANGNVTDFRYQLRVSEAFQQQRLGLLEGIGIDSNFLPADKAIVFVDNHDLQRGHAGDEGTLSHKNGALYDLANVFMLAWPYGYPMLMSSYAFEDSNHGPPSSRPAGACGTDWVCEHRSPAMTSMVAFRQATAGVPVQNWQVIDDTLLSFSRGEKGHLVINAGEQAVDATVATGMAPGEYCNLLEGSVAAGDCQGAVATVGDGATMNISMAPLSAVAIQASEK